MTLPSNRWDSYPDTLKLGEAELQSLLQAREEMQRAREGSEAPARGEDTRACRRLSVMGALWVPADIREPNGNTFRAKVYPIDLSASGACFIGDRVLPPGTQCTMTLRLVDGEMLKVSGKVVRSEKIQGMAHEVGMQLDEKLDMTVFFGSISGESLSPEGAQAKQTKGGVPGTRLAAMAAEIKSIEEHLAMLQQDSERLHAIGVELGRVSGEA